MKESLYSRKPNLLIGFHGCDKSVFDKIVCAGESLKPSMNDYDWLGHGMYFWENNYARALEWAEASAMNPKSSIKVPAVIGAVIDLGFCLDLMDSEYLHELKLGYETLEATTQIQGIPLPVNYDHLKSPDKFLRKLDCAVIETLHAINESAGVPGYDSVRGVFWEGNDLYPGAGFKEKNHIQICVRNPNCIKAYFSPRSIDSNYPNP